VNTATPRIDEALVRVLIGNQFPQWAHLPIRRVAHDGWDNRSFRLGEDMVVRLPSAAAYAAQVEKEHEWLPVLATALSFPIPTPLALGTPDAGYAWPWSVYCWLDGVPAESRAVAYSTAFAGDIAAFIAELQRIEPSGGPLPGPHNFFRGGPLAIYDAEVREAIGRLEPRINTRGAIELWESALRTSWSRSPVWLHGDISAGNLLSHGGRLSGVLDFGSLAIGDPACDLSIAWTLFRADAQRTFQTNLRLDAPTWLRARAWTLWKGLIVAANLSETNAAEWVDPFGIIEEVLRGTIDA
jgi:aminoglycoside phosphotransferase (APT) family kinase protein